MHGGRREQRTSQNLAPIWFPHWPAWMCTISRMVTGRLQGLRDTWSNEAVRNWCAVEALWQGWGEGARNVQDPQHEPDQATPITKAPSNRSWQSRVNRHYALSFDLATLHTEVLGAMYSCMGVGYTLDGDTAYDIQGSGD